MTADLTPYDALLQFMYQAPIGLLQTTLDGEITMINPMSAQLLMPLAPNGSLDNLFDVLAEVAPQLRALAGAERPAGEIICEGLRFTVGAGTGGAAAQTLSLRLQQFDQATLMASLTDITHAVQQEQQRLTSRLRDVARTDSLTSMPNRAVVIERLDQALARSHIDPDARFAVLFINGDRFNRVNATLGQAVGDELLRLMAGRLQRTVRVEDTVDRVPLQLTAARLGGDEFVVVLDRLRSADDIHGIAQRLVDSLCKPYGLGGQQVHLSASVGVVLCTQPDGTADSVLQDASTAMREAKRAGGARHALFEPAMRERAARLGSIESDLRRALSQDELFVVYQPIVRMSDNACAGAEALVRWRHPTRGLVSPIDFIGIAEETGLIGAVGRFVLEQACRQFMRWRALWGEQAPGMMSVNVSRAQLADATLADEVRQVLHDSGMPAAALQLEVTESLAAQDDMLKARLHQLKALGVTLALDDFGTGYSSLACLHLLPVDVVKIDRSFVNQVETSAHHRVLIEATIMVARSLGMGTVAEGIETPGQAAGLARLHCDKGQGYLYAKPMTADEATRWLAARLHLATAPSAGALV